MKLFYSSLLLLVAIGMVAAYVVIMVGAGVFVHWVMDHIGYWAAAPLIGIVLLCGIWFEKHEQKRLGVKRPLFR
jgi:cytochrome bd-type quinol oxidase subunit 2